MKAFHFLNELIIASRKILIPRRKVRLTVDVPLVDKPIYNVIGTIYGEIEPGKYYDGIW